MGKHRLEETMIMEWTTPGFEEFCVNCEIGRYSNATV
jgi:hypothetical protein